VEWGRYKVPQQPPSARGDNFPSTRATTLFCLPSLLNQSLGHGWSAFHLIFYISSPSSFILVLVSLFFSGFLSFFFTHPPTPIPVSRVHIRLPGPPPLCRLHLNPRPVSGRLLIRQFTLLYHSAVQPCYCRVGLHIQELFIARFISPACGGDRSIHAHQILTSALFCCKIYRLF